MYDYREPAIADKYVIAYKHIRRAYSRKNKNVQKVLFIILRDRLIIVETVFMDKKRINQEICKKVCRDRSDHNSADPPYLHKSDRHSQIDQNAQQRSVPHLTENTAD